MFVGQIKTVTKGWGYTKIMYNNEHYCKKYLIYEANKRGSLHYHKFKDETWEVISGKFEINYIDLKTGKKMTVPFNIGDIWRNVPGLPHQLVCLEAGTVLEISTKDDQEDKYRVAQGD